MNILTDLAAGGTAGAITGIMGGIGQLGKDIRQIITGEISPEAKAVALGKLQEMENGIQLATISVALAEAQSSDKWTSRARPSFLYVMYTMILFAIPFGFLYAFRPEVAAKMAEGVGAFLKAVPSELWYVFGAGYLGYGAFRSYDKNKNGGK